jgi:putative transposase
MVSEHHLSERRACRLVGLSRDSYRHPPQADQATQDLHEKIVEIAHVRRRFGYRRIHDLLRPQFPGVNHKRVYRLYRQANLAVRRRKKGKRPINERVPLQLARTVNEVWSMDFVSDSLSGGRRLKYLTVADDFSHESVEIAVDFGISGHYVTRVLDRAALFRGYPQAVRTDNGPEFTSRAFMPGYRYDELQALGHINERALASDVSEDDFSMSIRQGVPGIPANEVNP